MTKETADSRRIVLVGGGCAGANTALHLQRRLRRQLRSGAVEIVVINADPHLTYRSLLPEAAAGSVSPRHVLVPLRHVLPHCRVLVGEVTEVDHAERTVAVRTPGADEDGGRLRLSYDELVLAPGSVCPTAPVPGLADLGLGLRTVPEAIRLRNHVLAQLDIASTTRDAAVRDAALTFVVVGGGFAGVAALAELEDMARAASRHYGNLEARELRWLLVEAGGRILPEAGGTLGRHALRELRGRNVDVRLGTRLESCTERVAVLSDGSRHPTRTLLWTAGVRPHPLLATTGFPLTARGRLRCAPTLRVEGTEHVWAAGDAAAVPDLAAGEEGKECAPHAQHAIRQARTLADNMISALQNRPLSNYRYAGTGSVAALGLHKGVALLCGRRVRGYPAWFMHRAYHLSRVPTFRRKTRTLAEWTLSGLFTREIVALGPPERP